MSTGILADHRAGAKCDRPRAIALDADFPRGASRFSSHDTIAFVMSLRRTRGYPQESAKRTADVADMCSENTHNHVELFTSRRDQVMPLEPVLPFDAVEHLADLVGRVARVAQCLPPHVSAALAYRYLAVDADAMAERATAGSRDTSGVAKVSRRIIELVSRFEDAVATTGTIPRPTSSNVTRIYKSILGHHAPPETQDRIQHIWEETVWAEDPPSMGPIADLWQGAHRARPLAAIDKPCEAVGLILLHGCFLRLRGSALPWPVAAPLIAEAGPGPVLGHHTARDLLSACPWELERLVPACGPDRLQARLRDQAIRDCRLQRIGPVIDAMFWRPSLARGEVRAFAQVSDRTARRDIRVMQETGWVTAESEKGPLVLAIPRTFRLVEDN